MQDLVIETISSESLVNSTILWRYTISRKIDSGSYGQIYKVIDQQDPQRHLAIKISEETDMLASEIKVNRVIEQRGVVEYGVFMHQGILKAFMIMPRYGLDLHQYFHNCGKCFSDQTVVEIGTSLLSSLQKVHNEGYVYNDLKPDNILVDYCAKMPKRYYPGNAFRSTSLNLIDFGFAQKYRNKDKSHQPRENIDVFKGNLVFASRDQLKFKKTSRKDDLESLMYLLIYFLNDGVVLDISHEMAKSFDDQLTALKLIKKIKLSASIDDLCKGGASKLKPFCREILKIKYDEKPDYEKLKNALGALTR